MEYVIRAAEIKDIEINLLNIFIKGYNLHHNNRPDKFSSRTNNDLRNILIESMNEEDFLVIEHKNKIIGYIDGLNS